ncbi:zinc ribbon domain-containing protein [bacterium]|nr:zinc ribbon domain-containing protein [bacterium]
MECPKCGAEIDKSAMVCPNCKKVLKIVCPVCRTVNEKNICKKCGEILVVKCSNCGKINMMKNQKCIKCGHSTEISAVQAESNADTFAVVKIDFPNYDVIKTALGSNQLFTKFKANIDKMINGFAHSHSLRRQIVKNGIYLLRFNKAYTMSSSANSAIEGVIELAKQITRLNVKLISKKNIFLKANFTIMKRDADKDPYDIETGFQANMLNQSNDKSAKALESCQVTTDDDFEEFYSKTYKMESLDSALVNGKMKRFFEINIKEFIPIDDYVKEAMAEEEEANPEVPNFVNEGMLAQDKIVERTIEEVNEIAGEDLYSVELINFDEINCAFYTTENVKVLDNITEVLQEVPKGIIGIKGSNMYQPYTISVLANVSQLGLYQNIIPITCHDNMKYSPYSFFRELVSSIFDFTVSQKLFDTNDFSSFSAFDSDNLIKDLINLKQRGMDNLEDTRQKYFEVFLSLLQSIPETLIYVENFEKIDSSSMFVLGLLFDHFEEMKISCILSYDKEFSLHKYNHFLLSRPYYTEITLIPTTFENIVEAGGDYYSNIKNDFFFKRISKYAAGSTLFIDYAIQYLIESEVYSFENEKIELLNAKTTMIPSSLKLMMQRRLNLMKDEENSLKFLSMCALLGARVDSRTAESLGIEDWKTLADELSKRGFLYFYNDSIYFPNYNILRENILEIYDDDKIKELASELFEKVFTEQMPAPEKATMYSVLEEHQKVISEWENLANLDLSMGDFSAYLNCSGQLIKALDKNEKDMSKEELASYKSTIYENIANNMFEYDPEQTREIADKTLEDLQKTQDKENFTDLCTKMIQGALNHGEYLYALGLTHKILTAMNDASIDPSAKNFDLKFLLMSIVHIKILFGIGAYNDCIDIGYNVFNALESSKLETIEYTLISKDDLKFLISEAIAYVALSDILTLREDVNELLTIVNKLYDFVPKEYAIFVKLQDLIKGNEVSVSDSDKGKNPFTEIVYHIIKTFTQHRDNPTEMAKEIYKTKLVAKESFVYPFELFADLVIGYSYAELKSYYKASSILYEVVKASKDKGLNAITFMAWYVLSIMNMKQGRFDIAYGMLNNSSIQMEKLGGVSDYLMLLIKFNMFKLMKCLKVTDKADICLAQAQYIVKKYGLNFNTDIDIDKFLADNNIDLSDLPETKDSDAVQTETQDNDPK